MGVAAWQLHPAAHARAGEHAQDRRGEERVAFVDRQPDAREGGEHSHRHDARDRTGDGTGAQPRQRQHPAERGRHEREGPQDRPDSPRDVLWHLGDARLAVQSSAVCRVLVSDHGGFPVTAQSLATHTIGAAAASSASRASWPGLRGVGSARYSQYSPENAHASGRSSPASAEQHGTGAPARRRRVSTISAPNTNSR